MVWILDLIYYFTICSEYASDILKITNFMWIIYIVQQFYNIIDINYIIYYFIIKFHYEKIIVK